LELDYLTKIKIGLCDISYINLAIVVDCSSTIVVSKRISVDKIDTDKKVITGNTFNDCIK